ncbi:MAG: hypothetical protein ACYDAD_06540 [Acidimicrobiales bacterium]
MTRWAVGAATLATTLLAVPTTAADAGVPLCQNTVSSVPSSAHFDAGQISSDGIAGGTIGGIDLSLVDRITPPGFVKVFRPNDATPGATEIEGAGGLVSLNYQGIFNTILAGKAPVSHVSVSAFPLDQAVKTFTGAQVLGSVTFSGRITIFNPTTVTCQSVSDPSRFWTLTASRVRLDGYYTSTPTPLDSTLQPYGLGTEISILPGDTSSL